MPNTIKKQTRTTKAKSAILKPTSSTRINARKTVSKTARKTLGTSTLKTVRKTAGKTAKAAAAGKLQPKKTASVSRRMNSHSWPKRKKIASALAWRSRKANLFVLVSFL